MPAPTPSPNFVQYVAELLNELIGPLREDTKPIENKTSCSLR